MIILTLRTDNPEAEIGLYDSKQQLAHETWQAHRQLAETLHLNIAKNLQLAGKEMSDIKAVVVFQGPGSFTGLRIGISVANALASGIGIPIIGAKGKDWVSDGISALLQNKNDRLVVPEYGSPPHITEQKK